MAKPAQPKPHEGEVLDPNDPKVKEVVQHVVSEMYVGPLPQADDFAAYEKVQAGAADRIIKMAEKSLDAEVFAIKADKVTDFVAMLLGRSFLYVLLAGAIYLAINDKPVEAFFAALAPIVSIIYSTFKTTGSKPRRKKN